MRGWGKRNMWQDFYKALSIVAAGIILITRLNLVQAQTKSHHGILTEAASYHMAKISGRLVFGKIQRPIPNADAFHF